MWFNLIVESEDDKVAVVKTKSGEYIGTVTDGMTSTHVIDIIHRAVSIGMKQGCHKRNEEIKSILNLS